MSGLLIVVINAAGGTLQAASDEQSDSTGGLWKFRFGVTRLHL
jgi:hypothetical protein